MNDISNIPLENLDISEDRKYMIRILQNTYRENLDFIQHYLNQNNIIHQNINNLINNSFTTSRIRTNNNASSIFNRPINRRRPPPPPPSPPQAQPIRYTVTEDPRTQLPNTSRSYINGYNYLVFN